MKLKNSIIAAWALVLGIGASSCSDWLDYTPKDKQSYEQQFSSEGGFHNALNGVYNLLSDNKLYGKNLSYGAIEVMACCYNIPTTNTTYTSLFNANYAEAKAAALLEEIWSGSYNAILNVNLLFQALEENPGVLKSDDAKLIEGELYGLRGFLHFDLLRLFGSAFSVDPDGAGIPYSDSPVIENRERMTSKAALFDKILPDLNKAQEILKECDPVLSGSALASSGTVTEGNWNRYRQLRMNYYAVTLTKARAYLWAGDYANALTEAKKITDDPKAAQAFPWVDPSRVLGNSINPDRIFSSECIFGFYNAGLSNVYSENFAGTLNRNDILQPGMQYTTLLFMGNAADYRMQTQWATSASATGDYDFVKYRSFTANEDNPEFWATFYGLMRTSEAYLIASEACAMTGDMTNAVNYLNEVRTHRGEQAYTPEMMPMAQLLIPEVKYEYNRDLRGEGQLFFLFKRFQQMFGSYLGGDYLLDGSLQNMMVDLTYYSQLNRYDVPIPASETF